MTDSADRRPRPRPWPDPRDTAWPDPRETAPGDNETPAGPVQPAWLGESSPTPEPADEAPDGGPDGGPGPAGAEPERADAEPDARSDLGGFGAVAVAYRRRTRPPDALPARRPRKPPRGPAGGLAALLLLGLLSAFFAWVTAEPFWLTVQHSEPGVATVTRCSGKGLDRRCAGTFTSADGRFVRTGIPVMGKALREGGSAPARMTSVRGARAYVGDDSPQRAVLGLALLLLCGIGTAWATGAWRLPTGRARLLAAAACLAGPLALFGVMLATTF